MGNTLQHRGVGAIKKVLEMSLDTAYPLIFLQISLLKIFEKYLKKIKGGEKEMPRYEMKFKNLENEEEQQTDGMEWLMFDTPKWDIPKKKKKKNILKKIKIKILNLIRK